MLRQRSHVAHPPRHRELRQVTLSQLERQVVTIARTDTLASLREDRRVRWVTRKLTGSRCSNKLADPRLEALRRFAVIAHHDPAAIDDAEIGRMRQAGFSVSQMDEACELVDQAPPRLCRLWPSTAAVLFVGSAAIVGFLRLHAILEDPLVAAAVTGVLLLPFLPIVLAGTARRRRPQGARQSIVATNPDIEGYSRA